MQGLFKKRGDKNQKLMVKVLPIALLETITSLGSFALAFSGGLDSRFLAHAAKLSGAFPVLLHARGLHVPAYESAFAREWANKHKLDFIEFEFMTRNIAELARGDRERCYFCKKELLSQLKSQLQNHGYGNLPICDGTNADDLLKFRPGNRAVQEAGIYSPLALARLAKSDIRALAKKTGLDFAEQKARPCLLTRFNYGVQPNFHLLPLIAQAEQKIENFLNSHNCATAEFRIRFTPSIELHLDKSAANLACACRALAENCGIKIEKIRFMDQISGHYDREIKENK